MNLDFEWKNRGYGIQPDGRWQAELTILATAEPEDTEETFTEQTVLTKLDEDYAIARNKPHPFAQDQPNLKCNMIALVENPGPQAIKYKATYDIPLTGEFLDSLKHPLLARPRVSWSHQYKEIPTDYDYAGRFYCNSAGFPPSQQRTRKVKVWILTLTRFEPFFNLGLADTAMNCVNNAPVNIGPYQFDTGQVYVDQILPAVQDYQAGATYLPIRYALEFDSHAKHPYQDYLRDIGLTGWYQTAGGEYGTGPFGRSITTNGATVFVPCTEPILLNGTDGRPYQTGSIPLYQVGILQPDGTYIGATAVANPYAADPMYQCAAPGIPRPKSSLAPSGIPWVRPYEKVGSIDLNILGLGFGTP